MERKYFIRTKDFCEIISDENYVKIIIGEWSSFGKKEDIKNTDIKNFENKEQQKQYFNEKVNYYSNNGYIQCERATIIPSLEELENYDFDNDIYNLDYSYKDEDVNFDKLCEMYKDINCKHLCIPVWYESCYSEGPYYILDYLIKNKENYQNIEYFTIGNMNYEWGEISWINQADYTEFFKAFPNIKGMFIQGSGGLKLGKMNLPKLEILELQGSGLRNEILEDITNSNLPNLKRLNLYFGVENYGCDVEIEYVKNLLNNTNFEELEILGLCNINYALFSDVLELIFKSKYIEQIKVLDISKSVSLPENIQYIFTNIEKLKKIRYIDLSYNFILKVKDYDFPNVSANILNELGIEIDLNNENNSILNYFEYNRESRTYKKCLSLDEFFNNREIDDMFPMYTE